MTATDEAPPPDLAEHEQPAEAEHQPDPDAGPLLRGATATYSPEDNKLRLYPLSRLSADLYARVKAAGFIWAPKQELFVAPAWGPGRVDLLIELCGEVGDEDTTLVDRAEERAERFDDYSEKREAEAVRAKAASDAISDGIPFGQPILVGHHSERRARKDAEKIRNGMTRAVKLWETSKYWEDRAAGALAHAKYKELPAVRARRIKGLESDRRKRQKTKDNAAACLKLWNRDDITLTVARHFANHHSFYVLTRPDTWSAWDVLQPEEKRYRGCPGWTVEQVKAAALRLYPEIIAHADRWLAHFDNRLTYERAMLAASGGTVADRTKPEKGGAVLCWVGSGKWLFIEKVNKVTVSVLDNWGNGGRDFRRNVELDKLRGVMTVAQVAEAKAAGRLIPAADGRGFHLAPATPPAPRPVAEPDPRDAEFRALKEQAKAGVRVVVAPCLFPTPPDVARQMVELADIGEGMNVLEPSAGTGNLVRAILDAAPFCALYMVEINPQVFAALPCEGMGRLCADFLTCQDLRADFDRVVMNPPFDHGSDIKHVERALSLLAPGGKVVALVCNGPRQRERFEPVASAWIDLPDDTFKAQGTSVRTAIVVIDR